MKQWAAVFGIGAMSILILQVELWLCGQIGLGDDAMIDGSLIFKNTMLVHWLLSQLLFKPTLEIPNDRTLQLRRRLFAEFLLGSGLALLSISAFFALRGEYPKAVIFFGVNWFTMFVIAKMGMTQWHAK